MDTKPPDDPLQLVQLQRKRLYAEVKVLVQVASLSHAIDVW